MLKFIFFKTSYDPLVTMMATPIKDMTIPKAAFSETLSFRKIDARTVVIIGFEAAIRDVFTLDVYFSAVKKNR